MATTKVKKYLSLIAIPVMTTLFIRPSINASAPGLSDCRGLSSTPLIQNGFDYDRYEVGSLKQIIEYHAQDKSELEEIPEGGKYVFTADQFPSKVSVKYTGQIRDIPPKRKELISMWARSYRIDQKHIDLFAKEMLFIEGSDKHWLPVQTQLIPHFRNELKNGETVSLYTIWVGYYISKQGTTDWMFLVNEFQKPQAPKPIQRKKRPTRSKRS